MMKCCICKAPIKDFGHNPQPVMKRGRCCDSCNFSIVIPVRIKRLRRIYKAEYEIFNLIKRKENYFYPAFCD